MVAGLHLVSLGSLLVLLLEGGDDGFGIVFDKVTFLNHEVGSVFQPHVVAEGTFATALQGRSVAAVGTAVVLPCYVIHTFRIHASVASVLEELWLALGDGKDGLSTGTHSSVDEQFAVVGELISHLLSEGVGHHKLSASADAQTRKDVGCRNLNHLLTLT